MKLKLDGNKLVLIREPGDKKCRPSGYQRFADLDSPLLFMLRNALKALGADVIKQYQWRDGHLTSDAVQYVRARNKKSAGPHIYVFNGDYALRAAADDWNVTGKTNLDLSFNVFGVQPDCRERLEALLATQ